MSAFDTRDGLLDVSVIFPNTNELKIEILPRQRQRSFRCVQNRPSKNPRGVKE